MAAWTMAAAAENTVEKKSGRARLAFFRKTKGNLRNLRNYTVKLADVGCTKPKIDNKTACFYLTMTYSKDKQISA